MFSNLFSPKFLQLNNFMDKPPYTIREFLATVINRNIESKTGGHERATQDYK
jgi:hypothetical protein